MKCVDWFLKWRFEYVAKVWSLKKFEVEFEEYEVDDVLSKKVWSWITLKLKNFQVKEDWGWRSFRLKKSIIE